MDLSFTFLMNYYARTHAPVTEKEAPNANRRSVYGFLNRTLEVYEFAMAGNDWVSSDIIAKRVNTDVYSAKQTLDRMLKFGLVELDTTEKTNKGRPICRWRWVKGEAL